MPIYEFECKKCNERYDELCPYDPSGKWAKVQCPKCKSKKKEKRVSSNVYVMNTSSQNGIFEIAAGKNMERAQGERRAAEAASHVGTNPFGSAASMEADLNLGEGIHDPEFRGGLS